ncbi:MAG: zf-HC2 domain-containing protein [Chthonomonas sp.]|nr:zf-HC2 domain-containing protein [Chthonomonas sp.]
MNCAKFQALMSAYVDGELGGKEMLAVRAHIERCPACAAELSATREVKQALSSMGSVEVPEGFEDRLVNVVMSKQRGPLQSVPTRWKVAMAGTLATAAAAVIVVQAMTHSNADVSLPTPKIAQEGSSAAVPTDVTGPQPPLFLVANGQ